MRVCVCVCVGVCVCVRRVGVVDGPGRVCGGRGAGVRMQRWTFAALLALVAFRLCFPGIGVVDDMAPITGAKAAAEAEVRCSG